MSACIPISLSIKYPRPFDCGLYHGCAAMLRELGVELHFSINIQGKTDYTGCKRMGFPWQHEMLFARMPQKTRLNQRLSWWRPERDRPRAAATSFLPNGFMNLGNTWSSSSTVAIDTSLFVFAGKPSFRIRTPLGNGDPHPSVYFHETGKNIPWPIHASSRTSLVYPVCPSFSRFPPRIRNTPKPVRIYVVPHYEMAQNNNSHVSQGAIPPSIRIFLPRPCQHIAKPTIRFENYEIFVWHSGLTHRWFNGG